MGQWCCMSWKCMCTKSTDRTWPLLPALWSWTPERKHWWGVLERRSSWGHKCRDILQIEVALCGLRPRLAIASLVSFLLCFSVHTPATLTGQTAWWNHLFSMVEEPYLEDQGTKGKGRWERELRPLQQLLTVRQSGSPGGAYLHG